MTMNKAKPLVTIAVPTYNRADSYLKKTLESVVQQTYSNIEIIVSDNCSTDNTETVVKGFNDLRIQYFKQKENIGAYNNFDFCLKQAKGKYLLILGDDDLTDNDFIETCIRAVSNSLNVGMIRTGTRIIDSNGNIIKENLNQGEGLSIKDFFVSFLSGKMWMFLCSTLFNTKRLKEIGGFKYKNNLFHDVIAEFQLAARFDRIDVQDVKASFRKHSGEMSFGVKVKDWCNASIFLLDIMCSLVPNDKDLMVKTGMPYFARLCYDLASRTRSPLKRSIAYLIIFKKFEFLYIPPSSGKLYSKTFNLPLRFIRKMKQVLGKGV